MEEARRKEEEATLALLAASTAQRVSKVSSSSSSSDSEEEIQRPKTPVVEKVEAALAQSAFNGDNISEHEVEIQRRTSSSSSETSHTMAPVNVDPELLEIQEPKEDEAAIRRMKLLEVSSTLGLFPICCQTLWIVSGLFVEKKTRSVFLPCVMFCILYHVIHHGEVIDSYNTYMFSSFLQLKTKIDVMLIKFHYCPRIYSRQ